MKYIIDLWREIRIEYHFFMGCSARPHSRQCREHFDRMAELMSRRSPEQKRRLSHGI